LRVGASNPLPAIADRGGLLPDLDGCWTPSTFPVVLEFGVARKQFKLPDVGEGLTDGDICAGMSNPATG